MVEPVASSLREAKEFCTPVSQAERTRAIRRAEVRLYLQSMGHTITSWAKAHGYSRKLVYKVLAGDVKGLFGTSHEIAVKLGIKKEGDVDAQQP